MSKKERLKNLLEGMFKSLPASYRGIASAVVTPHLSKASEEDIDKFIKTARIYLNYVEKGEEGYDQD